MALAASDSCRSHDKLAAMAPRHCVRRGLRGAGPLRAVSDHRRVARDPGARGVAGRAESARNDDPLARAFSRSPVVAATALVSRATDAFDPRSATKSSFVILAMIRAPWRRRFRRRFCPCRIAGGGGGLGAINYVSDGDQIIRKGPLLFALGPPGKSVLAPSFAVESLRVAFQTDTPLVKSTNASGERFGASIAPSWR